MAGVGWIEGGRWMGIWMVVGRYVDSSWVDVGGWR